MANKYLNVLVGGAATPINITDVVAINATGNDGDVAGSAVITYINGSTLTLASDATDNGFDVAAGPSVVRSLWEAIIAAGALPWNLVIYPSPSVIFDWTILPAVSQASQYVGQDGDPAGSASFAAKQSSSVAAKDGGAIVWTGITIG